MTSWHVETDFVALALFAVMLIRNINEKRNRSLQHKVFFMVLILSIVSAVIDSASGMALNMRSSWLFCDITLTMFMMTIPMLPLAWYCYSVALMEHRSDREKIRIMKMVSVPCLIYMVIAASNPLNHWFYTLTRDMDYSRGTLYYILGIGMMLIYSFMSIIILIRGRNSFGSRSDGVLLIVLFIVAASSICIEALIPGLLLTRVAYAVLYTFCSMTIESEYREYLYVQIDRQNESLKKAVKEARSANREKNDFFSQMSHEIRTPMNGIIGMTHIALGQDDPDEKNESLKKIDKSSKFLLSLINDILDMQKADSGAIVLHPEPYLMSDFDEYIESMIKPLYEEKHQVFTLETHPVKHVIPIIDSLRFNQIMFNLLSNAVKYTQDGGSISLKVFNELAPDHREHIVAEVSDNGMGMSREFQEVLFEQYTQEERKASAEIQGTGLGLSIVRKMVDLMGGTITVDSELDRGTTFKVEFYFDYIEADQDTWTDDVTPENSDYSSLEGKHVILCEDNELNIEIARALLEEKGMEVTTASDGRKCVDIFINSYVGEFDMILMDIRMPEMNGCDAAQAIRGLDREDARKIPVIAMTADVFDDDVKRCLDAGMNGYIAKPVEPEKLYGEMLKFLCD